MNIYSVLALVNICLATLLVVLAGYRLHSSASKDVQQSVASTILLAVCIVVMYALAIIKPPEVTMELTTLLWRFVDMLSIVVLISLVNSITSNKSDDSMQT